MEFKEYQTKINRAIPKHESEKDEKLHWAIGLSEEVGELLSVLKHHFYGGEDFNVENFVKEAGDVLWYLTTLCTSCNINLDKVAEINVAKLNHRFPEDTFSDNNSKQRHELEKKFDQTELYKKLIEEVIQFRCK